jgi:hypothetical protein
MVHTERLSKCFRTYVVTLAGQSTPAVHTVHKGHVPPIVAGRT